VLDPQKVSWEQALEQVKAARQKVEAEPDEDEDEDEEEEEEDTETEDAIKFTKEEVAFEHPASGTDLCKDCIYYLAAQYGCKVVLGRVEPNDWCEEFEHE
jgi:hypothetical protein